MYQIISLVRLWCIKSKHLLLSYSILNPHHQRRVLLSFTPCLRSQIIVCILHSSIFTDTYDSFSINSVKNATPRLYLVAPFAFVTPFAFPPRVTPRYSSVKLWISLFIFVNMYIRSLGALRAPTSSLRPFGPPWLRPLRPSGAQAVWPTQRCIR